MWWARLQTVHPPLTVPFRPHSLTFMGARTMPAVPRRRRWCRLLTVAGCLASLTTAHPAPAEAHGASVEPVQISQDGGNALRPVVAMGPEGEALAAWEGFDGPPQSAKFAVHVESATPAGVWSEIKTLSAPEAQNQVPALVVNQAGEALEASEQRGKESLIEISARSPGGEWEQPTPVSGDRGGSPEIALDERGDAIVAWEQGVPDLGRDAIWASVRAQGGQWTPAQQISAPGESAALPHVAIDANGDAIIVWQRQGVSGGEMVQAAIKLQGEAWQSETDLTSEGEIASNPQVAVDAQGDAAVVWQGYAGDEYIVEGRSGSVDGEWTPAVQLSTQAGFAPSVAMTPGGGAVATWAGPTVQAAEMLPGGAWQPPRDLSAPGGESSEPRLAINAAGQEIAVWERFNGQKWVVQAALGKIGGAWAPASDIGIGVSGAEDAVGLSAAGQAAIAWGRWNGEKIIIDAAYLNPGPPLLQSLSIPEEGNAGTAVPFSVAPLDLWAPLETATWAFGDGSTAIGASASHVYAAPGTYQVSVEAEDVLGQRTSTSSNIVIAPQIEAIEFNESPLSGDLAPAKLKQTIPLPNGSSFDGRTDLNVGTGAGSLAGTMSLPAFQTHLKRFGRHITSLGLSLSEVGPVEGAFKRTAGNPGEETLNASVRLELAVTSVSIAGAPSVPVECATWEPITLPLSQSLTIEQLRAKALSFSGEVPIPAINCHKTVTGVTGSLLSRWLTGAQVPYTLTFGPGH